MQRLVAVDVGEVAVILTRGVERRTDIDPEVRAMWRVALRYSAVGLEMAVAITGGYLLGHWLDGKLGTEPYLGLVLLLVGIAAGFRGLIRVAREVDLDRIGEAPEVDRGDAGKSSAEVGSSVDEPRGAGKRARGEQPDGTQSDAGESKSPK